MSVPAVLSWWWKNIFYDLLDLWLMSTKDCASIKVVWWVNRTLSKLPQSLLKRHIRDKALIHLGMRFSDCDRRKGLEESLFPCLMLICHEGLSVSSPEFVLSCILPLWNLPGLSGVPFVEKQVLQQFYCFNTLCWQHLFRIYTREEKYQNDLFIVYISWWQNPIP